MNNAAIANNFSLLSKLMDIHRDNSFKAKSYSSAAYTIDKLPIQLASLEHNKIFSLKGIGESVGQKIIEQLTTGAFSLLQEYIAKTPHGIIEMLNIRGLGPKKIAIIWHDMEIESLGELLYACNENRLTLYKGFGSKTQQSIKENIEFYVNTLGSYLYQQIENYTLSIHKQLEQKFSAETFIITGNFRRQLEIIEKVEWVTTTNEHELINFFSTNNYQKVEHQNNYIVFCGDENVQLGFYCVNEKSLYTKLFITSCSNTFLEKWIQQTGMNVDDTIESEEKIFEKYHCHYIPPYRRENAFVIEQAMKEALPITIQEGDIKGIIHSHSTWSDGSNTIEEMANACIMQGLEYLIISDHSKTATYAQGLSVERVLAQHEQIDELNKKLFPFTIFKSIESDILGDGSLDYEPEILNKFDLVIASIHSNLKMSEEKAMLRLLNAIANPFTSIMGHLTGRLLLSRNGYPVNYEAIFDACVKHHVAIELNAHPRRLDIDWRYIEQALQKNILISINPDAHVIEGFADVKYGILVAQKAGLTTENNLSSFTIHQLKDFIAIQKQKRKMVEV
ncbi:MAG: DNA polymerase/3'-5' exonuclease PolX [Chitinophagaceae bacterium]|nr:DNA polymerase/3'-5' exonuclease PolX [Chitinophagaceae bacterium]MCW5904538.1 DNA polymerase/3'-5' exonuclease PolX [Chitinophagaceae bacterium]